MPQKKLFAALLVAASALLMLGMSNENQIPYPSNYDTKSAGASSYNGLANVPKSPYFQQLDFYNMQPTDSLVLLPKFRTYQQTTEYTCGPAAALMVVEHFQGRSEEDELAIGKIMGTKSYTGTNTKGMVKYFKKKGWQVTSSADKDKTPQNTQEFKAFVVEHLKRNVPIMVENVDWGGHWRVIIGYDTMGTDDITSSDVLIMALILMIRPIIYRTATLLFRLKNSSICGSIRICLQPVTVSSSGWQQSRRSDMNL